MLHGEVEDVPGVGDALIEEDIELGLPERRRHLVFHHLDSCPVSPDLIAVLDRADPPDVQPHRRVELQRPPAGRRLRATEHDADLLTDLVDEDQASPRLADVARQLAQRLAHEAGVESDVDVSHLPLELGPGDQRGDAVDDDDVESVGAHEHVGDLQGLLAGVRLRDEERVEVDAEPAGVGRVEGVLRVDEGRDAASLLGVGDDLQGQRRLARCLGAVDLDDPSPGHTADPQRHVEGEAPRGDDADVHPVLFSEIHDGPLTALLVDLLQCEVEGLLSQLLLLVLRGRAGRFRRRALLHVG